MFFPNVKPKKIVIMSKSKNFLTDDTEVLGVFNGLSFSFKISSCEMVPAQGVRARNVNKIDTRDGKIPKELFLNDGRIMTLTVSKEKISNHLSNQKFNPVEKRQTSCASQSYNERQGLVKTDPRRR